MKKILYTFAFCLIPYALLNSQQLYMTSHQYANPFLYNPAEIGNTDYSKAYLHTRKQWAGIDGAPETYLFSVDGAATDKVGLGMMLFNDVADIIGKTGGYGVYRYKIRFTKGHDLALGIAAGFLQNRIYFDRIRAEDNMESTILNNTESRSTIDANLGLVYTYQNLRVGVSSFQLFNSSFNYENTADFKTLSYKLIRHYLLYVNYKQQIANNYYFEPGILIKSAQGMPMQFDIRTLLNYRNDAWFGVTYQHRFGISFSAGTVVYKKIMIGYAYDISTTELSKFNGGSHEVVIGLRLNQFGTGSKSTGSHKDLDAIKKHSQEQYEKIDKLEQETDEMKKKIDENELNDKEMKEEIEKIKEIINKDKDIISSAITKYSINLDALDSINYKEIKADKEVFYIVLGAYLKLSDAKLFQRILEREVGLTTSLIEREDSKYFFVCSNGYKASSETKKEIQRELRLLNRLRINEIINGNPWVYNGLK